MVNVYDEIEEMLTDTRIWPERLVDIEVVSAQEAIARGLFWFSSRFCVKTSRMAHIQSCLFKGLFVKQAFAIVTIVTSHGAEEIRQSLTFLSIFYKIFLILLSLY